MQLNVLGPVYMKQGSSASSFIQVRWLSLFFIWRYRISLYRAISRDASYSIFHYTAAQMELAHSLVFIWKNFIQLETDLT